MANPNAIRRVIRFGGAPKPAARQGGCPDDEWAPLLGELSWKYVRDQAQFEPYAFPPPEDTEKLKKDIAAWVGRVWCHNHEMPEGAELRKFNILSLESEYREYIRKNGAGLFEDGMTVEEIWCSTQLYNASPFLAVMAEHHSDLASDRVVPKRAMPTDQIVWLLGSIFLNLNIVALNVLVSDGESGHTIVLSGLNGVDFLHPRGHHVRRGWFSFHDPWPARSLLAPERHYDGVTNVLEDVSRPPYWLISPEELNRVVVGFFINIDWLPLILDVMKSLDILKSMSVGWETPFWAERSPDPEALFPIMLAAFGNVTPTTADSLVGLGRLYLATGQPDVARHYFLDASRVDPNEAPFKAARWARGYGETELAKEIERIASDTVNDIDRT
jgi:hypothetical protein